MKQFFRVCSCVIQGLNLKNFTFYFKCCVLFELKYKRYFKLLEIFFKIISETLICLFSRKLWTPIWTPLLSTNLCVCVAVKTKKQVSEES